jgi:hypothetical protein
VAKRWKMTFAAAFGAVWRFSEHNLSFLSTLSVLEGCLKSEEPFEGLCVVVRLGCRWSMSKDGEGSSSATK